MKADAVFEGGGVKGIGLVGAVLAAEERGYRWVNLAGTSAGAIVAALLAAGYSARELRDILLNLDYRKFLDRSPLDHLPVVGPLASLVLELGLYEGRYFTAWLADLLKARGVVTFGDLVLTEYRDDPQYRYRLRVVASDITRGRLLILPQDIAAYGINPDDLEVALAVRMSMSIPFFFEPVILRQRGQHRSRTASVIVDGGLLSNFPVWLFDSPGLPEWPTFGFKLVEPQEGRPREIRGPLSLLRALIATMLEAHDARHIQEQDFVRTIAIPTLGIGTVEFDLDRHRAEALFYAGYEAAQKFFADWDFQAYVHAFRLDPPDRDQKGGSLA